MITVFTPTYNRAHTLPNLYKSLCEQTSYDFEWLVVDDGSTDGTKELIRSYQQNNPPFEIRYIYQLNRGKAKAINHGIKAISNDFVFFMDSDDYLAKDAITSVMPYLEEIKANPFFCGVTGMRIYRNGKPIGSYIPDPILDTDYLSFRVKYGANGDYADIVKTSVMREFPFPEFEGEKFCTEALVFNRIAKKYINRYVNLPLRVCEYLPGGLTDIYDKIMRESPQASLLFWKEYFYSGIPIKMRVSSLISYWKLYKSCHKETLSRDVCPTGLMKFLRPSVLLLGWMYFKCKRNKNDKKKNGNSNMD